MASTFRTRPSNRSGARRRHLAPLRILVALAIALATLPFMAASTAQAAVTTIAVDGDQDGLTTDWQGLVGSADVIKDGISPDDASGIRDQEDSRPWTSEKSTASGKSDIGYVRVSSYRGAADHLIGVIGFDRGSGSGTGRYYFELNQVKHDSINPTRTQNDVRIIISVNGNRPESCAGAQLWTGSAWGTLKSCSGIVDFAVNLSAVKDYYGSPFDDSFGNLPTNQFMELSVDLTQLGATTCPVSGFRTFSMRSQEGNENGENGQLKDTARGPVHIPSDCGSLVIEKTVDGEDGFVAAGAVFRVTPNPSTGTGSTVVTTGSDGTITIADAKPGSYSVKELAPPSGALLPAGASATKSVSVPKGLPGTVTFDDPYGTGAWTKSYEGVDPTGAGATFHAVRTQAWIYDVTPDGQGSFGAPTLGNIPDDSGFDVTDNGHNDTDSAMGDIAATGLKSGRWCVSETAAPDGWTKDPDTECFTVGPTDAAADAHPSLNPTGDPATFHDPLKRVALRVDKTESSDGVSGSSHPLGGVTFNLYADDNGAPGAQVGTGSTDAQGHVSFSGLDWQESYWLEEVAKDGFRIGLSPNPKKIGFTAADAGTTVPTSVDNPRTEWSIRLDKVDATTRDRLAGGTFELWRESNGNGTLERGGADPDTHLLADATLADGSLTFDRSDHDIPWGYHYYVFEQTPPTGYGTMSPNPIEVDATAKPAGPDPTLVYRATDPQLVSQLEVIKHDQQTDEVVDGASFDLYQDTNGLAGLQTTAAGGPPADQLVGSCGPTTGGNPCSVGSLGFGTYWWSETVAPTGYALPGDPRSGPVVIDAGKAGTTFPVTVISDPEVPANIKVVKLDKDTRQPLDGARFTLYADSNKDGSYDAGVDQVVGAEHGTAGGEYTWPQDLFWGTYFVKETAKPDLYDFDSTQVRKLVIERKDAGTTVSVTFEDPQIRRTVAVEKKWLINGVTYNGGVARDGFSADLRVDGTAQSWGDPRGGYLMGETATISEVPTVPANCVPVDARITEKNGDVVDIRLGENGYAASLPELTNHYTVTNTVTCSTRITLDKSVLFGAAGASSWNLSATGPGGSVTGTSGVYGSVPSAATYALAEANGVPTPAGTDLSVYQQSGAWSCVTDGPNGTAVTVVDGSVTPSLDTASLTCTVTNTTARLTLVKQVENTNGGDLAASDWKLTATPAGAGLSSKEVTGSTSGVTVEVKPGASYSLTESPEGGNGYHLSSLDCTGAASFTSGNQVSVAAGRTAVCTYTNVDEQPGWTVSKTDNRQTVVQPGDTITYTIRVTHTSGQIVPKDVEVTDDLSGVLDHASMGTINAPAGTSYSPNPFAQSDTSLTWHIDSLGAIGSSKELTYTVTVDDGAWDTTLVNGVTPKAGTGGSCDTAVGCSTTHTTPGLPRLTLVKEVVNGLNGDADKTWWRLSADREGGTVPATKSSLAGNGGDSGLVAKGSYNLAEADVAGDDHATSDYAASSWHCVRTGTQMVVPAPGSVVALGFGDDVTCTIVNTQTGHWSVAKSADRPDGGTYKPGEDIVYTLTATKVSGIDPTDVSVHDDLTELLKHATFVSSSDPSHVAVVGDELTWAVGTLSGTRSVTFTFHITDVKESAGVTITNLAWSPGSDNCPTDVVASAHGECGTLHHTPEWTLTKTSVPGDGVVQPTSSITYTLTVTNVSDATVAGMTVYDDVSGLLGDVDPAFLSNLPAGTTYDAADQRLVWSVPEIAAKNGTETISYTVTVDADAWEKTLKNVATPKDTTTGTCVGANDCATTHTTPKQPVLTLRKIVHDGISDEVSKTSWRLSATPGQGSAVAGNGGFGPTGVDPGTYALGEQLVAEGVDESDWMASDWSCVRTGTDLPAGLTERTTLRLVPDDDVTCTVENTRVGEWTVEKSSSTSDPFLPGGTITYTLKAVHTEGVAPKDVVLHDDLTGVMANAHGFDLGTPSAGSVDRTPDSGEPSSIDWTIPTLSGTETLTFTVKADHDAWDTELVNAVTSAGSENCPDTEHVAGECRTDDETPEQPRLTLVKRVTDPHDTGDDAKPSDWTVSATGVDDSDNAVSGNGDPSDESGVRNEKVLPGTFELDESDGPSGYDEKGWSCTSDRTEGGSLGDAFSASTSRVTLEPNDDVTCTVTNEAIPGTFKVEKSSDPTDGDTVVPGQTVTYTVKVTHLTGVAPRNVVVTDDLSDVLDDATDFTMVSSPAGATLVDPAVANGRKMSWTIAKLDDTATFVYSVKVAATAYGVSLRNVVVAPGSDYCPTAQSPAAECSTMHPTARWTLEKSSDPASGADVDPGDKVTYTLKATNISDAPVTGMTVTDDLSDVLDDATLDAAPAGATLSGTTLTWSVPTLAARGDAATLSYTVTVEKGSSLATLYNVATPDQPSGRCVAVDACETTHTTPEILGDEAVVPPARSAPTLRGVDHGLPSTGGPGQVWIWSGAALLLAGCGLVLASRAPVRRGGRRDEA